MNDQPSGGGGVRVLHVLGSLGRGGAETWLVQLLHHLELDRVAVEVLTHSPHGAYEPSVKSLGVRVICLEEPTLLPSYSNRLEHLLVEHGPYTAVHSHLQLFSGHILKVANRAGIQGRIAHFRNTSDGRMSTPLRRLYRALMRRRIRYYATHTFAVSAAAAKACGDCVGRLNSEGMRILTGLDLTPFDKLPTQEAARGRLGVSQRAPVIGHVGGFRHQKNHELLVRIAQEFISAQPDGVFLLVGDGALRPQIENQVREAGLASAFRFLGERSDVPSVLAATDAFLFPSRYEGLPRALLEAEAAGVPCVVSANISRDVVTTGSWIRFLPLDQGTQDWVEALKGAVSTGRSSDRGKASIDDMDKRGMSIVSNAAMLTELYEGLC